MLFSVGDTDGGLDGAVVVVEVVGVVDGASLPLLPHPAIRPIVIRATPPAAAIARRPMRFELMVNILSLLAPLVLMTVNPRRFGGGRGRQDRWRKRIASGWAEALFRRGHRRLRGG
jgi:hypothetical protein